MRIAPPFTTFLRTALIVALPLLLLLSGCSASTETAKKEAEPTV
jgi:hypothetical protein